MRALVDPQSLVRDLAVEARPNEPLAPLCSVRAGGAAELLVRPRAPEALAELVRRAIDSQVPLTVLGGGANTLVGDGGVPGITVKLPADLFAEQIDGARITLGAGAAIA